jgi:hypothetical protein
MKKMLIIPVAAFMMIACNNTDKKATPAAMTPEEVQQAKTDTARFTTIKWIDSPDKNLGSLKKDQEIEISYRFKNTGDNMLIIEDVKAGCGCTIPVKPEQPFAPGEEGLIKAKFDGRGTGHITKQITVLANTTPSKNHSLTFSGDIKE